MINLDYIVLLVEIIGGVVEKVIRRNTLIPALAIQEFTTYVDGQNSIQIHVCQGEREVRKIFSKI